MAVMKINNDKDYITGKSKYKDQNALQNVYDYMMDVKHFNKSKKLINSYMGGSHVGIADPPKSMEEVAQKFHKDRGVRLKHIILSFSEEDGISSHMAAYAAERMSQQIGQIYQNFYVVHEDHACPHIHMMMNTVSHINGYKYHPKTDKYWLSNIAADCLYDLGIEHLRVYGR